jgi:hypothetical protein
MLKTVLIVQHQQNQPQHHQKEIVVIEVHVMDVEVVKIGHVALMVLHQRKVEKTELLLQQQPQQQQQHQLLMSKLMIHIKIITHIIVCRYRLFFKVPINSIFFQIIIKRVKVVMELHGIMINKINEKRKLTDHLVSIRIYKPKMQQVNHLFKTISFLSPVISFFQPIQI